MINWTKLIDKNEDAVRNFAFGGMSGRRFYNFYFSGRPNEARQLIRERGVKESRNLAKRALRRRYLA